MSACVVLAGCNPWADGGAALGASMTGDGGSGDAWTPDDIVAPSNDAGGASTAVDASQDDAGADECGSCAAIDTCHAAACVDNVCVQEPVADGLPCTPEAHFICVGGACVERACGDGHREPGPVPEREGCDDGNDDDGDACTACAPRVYPIASRPSGWDETSAPGRIAAGVDGAGRTLVVWLAEVSGPEPSVEIHARRFDARGAPLDGAPLVLATSLPLGWHPDPEAIGLAGGGWIVSFLATEGLGRAMFARVRADGSLLPVRAISGLDEIDSDVRVAPHLGGFVAAWAAVGEGGLVAVRARRFASTGAAIEGPITIAAGGGAHGRPAISSSGAAWLVAWEHAPDPPASAAPRIVARRYDGPIPDGAAFDVSEPSASAPSLAALAEGDWAIAWTSRAADPSGDVRARRVRASGEPLAKSAVLDVSATPETVERAPSVAPLAGDAYLVAWEEGAGTRGAFARVGSAGPAAEDDLLVAALADPGFRGGVSVAPTTRGTWFVWSGRSGAADPTALRSVLSFLLPPE